MKLVSVIMPSYNTPYDFLESAVNSIINQTYKNLELIIIDDSSITNNDAEMLSNIIGRDSRIRMIKNTRAKGVAGALNTGILEAKGHYIIRMDSDDIAVESRIEKQVAYMEQHPEISVLAGYIKEFGASTKTVRSYTDNTSIKASLIFQSAIAHPTVCIRKEILDKYGFLYSEDVQSEDYELWTRMAIEPEIRFATLPEIVLNYRVHANQVTNTKVKIMREQGKRIRINYLSMLGINVPVNECEIFADYNMIVPGKYSVKQLLKIQNSVSKQAKVIPLFESGKFEKTFRKICAKKSVSHILKSDVKQFATLVYNISQYVTAK